MPPLPGNPGSAPSRERSDLDPQTASERAEGLLLRLAAHDPDTVGHLRRTAATVEAVATRLGWDAARVRWTTFGALLHDIGKMKVAPEVTFKPGPLSEIEQAAMRDHVVYGTRLVSEAGFPPLVARIVHDHHERLDGSGYPSRLRGREIDEEVRLVMLADIADAMLSRRPYKKAMPLKVVRDALQAGAGILFDAELIGPVVAELERREAAT
ncbi:putative nucleotidyltransferase with HDIG domain [Amorphus suaedae]